MKAVREVRRLTEEPDGTAAARLKRVIDRLGGILATDTTARVVPSSSRLAAEANQWLAAVVDGRRDVDQRREALDRLARQGGWLVSHTGTRDFIGPFRIDHTPDAAVVSVGAIRLAKLLLPSPVEILQCLQQTRGKLERDATAGWDQFFEAVLEAQDGIARSEAVRWRDLLARVIPDTKQQRRLKGALLYRLAMLLSHAGPSGWTLVAVPPTLGEQRTAIEVPRLDHPGESARVNRVRLSRG